MSLSKLIEHLTIKGKRDSATALLDSTKFRIDREGMTNAIIDGAAAWAHTLKDAGVLALPFDNCLFEFGGFKTDDFEPDLIDWVHVQRVGDLLVFRVYLYSENTAIPIHGTGVIGEDDFSPFGVVYDDWDAISSGWRQLKSNKNLLSPMSGKLAAGRDAALARLESEDDLKGYIGDMLLRGYEQMMLAIGLLSTGSGIEVEVVPAQKKFINQTRLRKGKPPLDFEYRVIRLDPSLVRLPGLKLPGRTHASPRLHWRRGHVRALSSGIKTPVKPCIVGDVSRGTIVHDYLVEAREGGKAQ